jgi:hypothetical protein
MAFIDEDKTVIDRFKKFGKTASDKFDKVITRLKIERAFASGYQWDDDDRSHRGDNRAELTFNVSGNQVNAVVNPFLQKPYKVCYTSLVQTPTDLVDKLNLSYQKLDAQDDTKTAKELGIRSMATAGYGYLYVTTDLDENKKPVIKIYPIEDAALVIPDPDSVQVDGSDSSRMAIVEYMSKSKAKSLYGEDVVETSYTGLQCLVSDFGKTWKSPEDYLTLVTFYEMTESRNACIISKMIGNKVISSVTLQISHIPIVTFKGEISYDKDGKTEYVGLIHKIVDGQKVLNYAESQLVERLANAPVPVMSVPKEGLEGNIDYYKNINRRLNPVVPYKEYSADGKKLSPPSRVDNSFPTSDITEVIGNQKSVLTEVSGLPLSGLVESADKETATSVLLRSKSTVNNISHYLSHAKQSMKFLGTLLMEFYKVLLPDTVIDTSLIAVTVNEGPEALFNSEEAKTKLIAIAGFLPENMKSIIAYQLCKLDVNPDVQKAGEMLKQLLPPQVFSDNGQLMAMQQQMADMQAKMTEVLQAKDKQINDLNMQVMNLQLRSNTDMRIAELRANTDLSKEAMRLQNDNQKQQLEIASKANIENEKIANENLRERERLATEAFKTQSKSEIEESKLAAKTTTDMIDRGLF